MKVQSFIAELHSANVRIWSDGDTLKLNSPIGTLTDSLKETLRARKPELIAALKLMRGTCQRCGERSNLQNQLLDAWFCPNCRSWAHSDGSPLMRIETIRPLTLERQEAETLALDLVAAGCSFIADAGGWNVRLPRDFSASLLSRFERADRVELQRAISKLAELELLKGRVN